MKKFILSSSVLVCLLFASCENEGVEVLPAETESSATESTVGAKGPWSYILWEPFDSGSNITNKWTKTNRKDYNSETTCTYKPSQVGLASLDGKQCLRLTAKSDGNGKYISGHIKSKKNFKPAKNQEIYVTARIKLVAKNGNTWKGFNQTYGAWPAFWTVNETDWPKKGELDIMEGYSYGGSSHFASNLFYGTSVGKNLLSNTDKSYSISEGWHTYQMRWINKNNVYSAEMWIDGKKKATYNDANTNKLKMSNFGWHNVILNLNVGSDDKNLFQDSKINLFSNTYMYVDYVAVKKRTI